MLLQFRRVLTAIHLIVYSQATTLPSHEGLTTPTSLPLPSPVPTRPHSREVFLVVVLPPIAASQTSQAPGTANSTPNAQQPLTQPHIYLRLSGSIAGPPVPTTLLTIYRWSAPTYIPSWYTLYTAWLWERTSSSESIDYNRLGEMRIRGRTGERLWMFRVGTSDIENTDILNPDDGRVCDAPICFPLTSY